MAAILGPLVGSFVGKAEQAHKRDFAKQLMEYKTDMRTYQLALDNAAKMGLWDDVGNITNLMNERTEELPGAKRAAKEGQIGNIGEIGGKLAGLFKNRQQQQQQQQRQKAALSAYDALPAGGAPTAPGGDSTTTLQFPFMPPAGAGGTARPLAATALPGMPPLRERAQELFKRLGPEIQQAGEAQEARQFERKRKEAGVESEDVRARKLADRKAYYDEFIKQGMPKERAEQLADEAVFGKVAAPPAQRLQRVANAPSDQFPELGIKGKTGTVFVDPATGKAVDFVETAGRAGADDLAKWAKVLQARNPKLTPEQAVQQAANELYRGKFLLPEERLQLQRDAVRTIVGESGILTVPTHQPGAAGRGATAAPFPTVLPAMPPRPAGAPGPSGGGVPAAAAPGGAPAAPAPSWGPRLRQGEVTAMDTAKGAMESAQRLSQSLPRLVKEHPGSFGTFRGRVTSAELPESGVPLVQGTAPAWTASVEADMHSLAGFLTGVHRARGVGYADRWAKVLGNPFVNPQYTIEGAKRLSQVAEGVMREAAKPTRQGMSLDDVIRDLQQTNPEIFEPLDEPPGGSAITGPPPSKLNPYR